MEHAQAYHCAAITDFNQVGVKATSDHTLEFTLAHPTPYFLLSLAQYFWYPIHAATIEAHGGIHNPQATWALPGRCVSNGPFILTQWEPWKVIELQPNPHYWNPAAVKLNGLKFYPFDDHHTEHRAFQAGQIHYVSRPAMDYIDQFKKDCPQALHIDEYLSSYYYRLNVSRPPLNDVRIRRALNLAIDRKAIVEKITRADEGAATRFTPTPFPNYPGSEGISYNPQQARQLLAEAGYPSGKGLPEIELLYNTSSNHQAIAEAIQDMWARELDVRCRLYNQEWRVYLGTLSQLNYEIARSQWIGAFVDPMAFLEIFTTAHSNNQTGWSSPQYDSLLESANRERNPHKRAQIMAEAEAILMNELPIIPVYWNTRTYLLDPRIRGWYPKLVDSRPYHTLWFECD
ncbi:MAG TPA: peptide ABC transporter substrate-binding protein, partial [Opitutales bacterium]|nr:peptide ABC transporter substrate-binding protein [Opitutales bacterium]